MAGLWQGPLCYRLLLEYGRAHDCRALDEQLAVCQYPSHQTISQRQFVASRIEPLYKGRRDIHGCRCGERNGDFAQRWAWGGQSGCEWGEPVGGIGSQHRWSVWTFDGYYSGGIAVGRLRVAERQGWESEYLSGYERKQAGDGPYREWNYRLGWTE